MKKYFFILLFNFYSLKLSINEKIKLIKSELINIKKKIINNDDLNKFSELFKNYINHFYYVSFREKEKLNKIKNYNDFLIKMDFSDHYSFLLNIITENEFFFKDYFKYFLLYPNHFLKKADNSLIDEILTKENKNKAEKNINFVFLGSKKTTIKHLKTTHEIIKKQENIKENYKIINNPIIEDLNENNFEEENELLKKKNINFYNLILKCDCFKDLKNIYIKKYKKN